MRRQRILITLAAVLVGVVVLQDPASANCIGPTLEYETGEFAVGDLVRVDGRGFGTECYDTGPPPEGEGALGPPIEGIEILVVQGDNQWVVATGDADDDYTFMVDVTLPFNLQPGEARITIRLGADWEPYIRTTEPVTITDERPEVRAWEVATFGPTEPLPADGETETIESTTTTISAPPTTTESSPQPDSEPLSADSEPGRATWIAVGMVIAAAAIGGLLVLSKR